VEGITRDEVVAAETDPTIDHGGQCRLGIAFNAKEILKKVADGALTRDHMKGILYCLGFLRWISGNHQRVFDDGIIQRTAWTEQDEGDHL